MKKLISVFAALALVGSLAAQKGKKAPAKPAAPAVAAPKAPAVPAVVAAAPSAASAGKGMGLFIEGFGSFSLGNGSSDTNPNGSPTATTIPYDTAATKGFGGGGTIGYNIVENLGLVAHFNYRQINSREFKVTAPTTNDSAIATVKKQTMWLGIGFRPQVKALGGIWYGGAGFAYVLGGDKTTQIDCTVASGSTTACTASAYFGQAGTTKTYTKTDSYNAGIGAYGEFGYGFSVTDNITIGVGIVALVATQDNKDKSATSSTTTVAGATTTATTNYVATTDTSVTLPAGTTQAAYKTEGITDITAKLVVGFRF